MIENKTENKVEYKTVLEDSDPANAKVIIESGGKVISEIPTLVFSNEEALALTEVMNKQVEKIIEKLTIERKGRANKGWIIRLLDRI